MVRGHYLRDLMDNVRLAKGGDKREKQEVQLRRGLEREVERIGRFCEARVKALEREVMEVNERLMALSSPHMTPTPLLYAARSFVEFYISAHAAFLKDLGSPTSMKQSTSASSLSTVVVGQQDDDLAASLAREREVKDGLFREYKEMVEEKAKVLAKQAKRKAVTEALKGLIRVEREFYLMDAFIERAFADLATFIQTFKSFVGTIPPPLTTIDTTATNLTVTVHTLRLLIPTSLAPLFPDPEDYTCPICLCPFHRPVITPTCRHRFCKGCLDEHERSNAVTVWSFYYFGEDASFVRTYFPLEYKERSAEERKRAFKSRLRVLALHVKFSLRRDAWWF
ncbi:hypothetical protein HK104_009224 [Borealophlyctis nickersoniae]|nr:hypothetical protein HK104_009224 [Borealophlyctis nickersoniae]